MRRTRITPASVAIFTLPAVLLSAILSPLFSSKGIHVLASDLTGNHASDRPRPPGALRSHDAQRVLKSGYEDLVERYVPDFVGISRSIIGRAGDEVQTLENNQPGKSDIQGGQTQYFTFPKDTLLGPKSPSTSGLPSNIIGRDEDGAEHLPLDELKKRQSQAQLFITLNTCSQPLPDDANSNGAASQLELFISTSPSNPKPDQSNNNYALPVDGGYANKTLIASDDVFISVSAPNNNGFTGNYTYELTASIDDFYALYYDQPFHRVVDTDTSHVLLYTLNTTNINTNATVFQEWMNNDNKVFSTYVYSQKNPAVIGIQKSLCALDTNRQLYMNPDSDDTSMTTAVDGQAKQQFYVQNLNRSSAYYAIMTIEGNSTKSGGGVVNGGGTVWASTTFSTKSDNSCVILHDLSFCTDVGYAVPWNPTTNSSNLTALGALYDNTTEAYYQWFNKSLQQVACNTTSSAQYSLARTCTDCANAYKQWLCAVTIPRCEDFSNTASYLQPRALAYPFVNQDLNETFNNTGDAFFTARNQSFMNSSRNPMIDQDIKPGPYKELLPCQDLCYNLVQSCPAVLQFQCPLPGFGLNYSYGIWNKTLPPGEISCNPMALNASSATSLKSNGMLRGLMTTAAMLAIVIV